MSNLANRNGKFLGFWRLHRSRTSRRWCSDSGYRIYFHLPPNTETLHGAVKCDKKQLVQPIPLEQLLVSAKLSPGLEITNPPLFFLVLLHLNVFKAKINGLRKCLLSAKCGSCQTEVLGRCLRKELLGVWSQWCSWHMRSRYLVWFRAIKLGFLVLRMCRNMEHKGDYSFVRLTGVVDWIRFDTTRNVCFAQRLPLPRDTEGEKEVEFCIKA